MKDIIDIAKVIAINGTVFGVVTLAQIELLLKICLLLLSIAYTGFKFIEAIQRRKKNNDFHSRWR